MKSLLLLLLSLTAISLTAQSLLIWKGGTPGKETQWNEPKNWDGNQTPDEFSFVIIKQTNSGHQAQPIIKDYVEVASIEIQFGGILTLLPTADLVIDGAFTFSKGLMIYGGQLFNEGNITLKNIDGQAGGQTASSDVVKPAVNKATTVIPRF